MRFISKLFIFLTLWCLIFNTFNFALAQDNDEERKVLELQLAELEKQIVEHEATIEKYKKQGKTLSSEVKQLDTKIRKINLQIKAIKLTLDKLNAEIDIKQKEIKKTQGKLDFNKEALSQTLQDLYERERLEMTEILLKTGQLSDIFSALFDLSEVQNSLNSNIDKITDLKNVLLDEREVLAGKRDDALALKTYQDAQKVTLDNTKQDKNKLLTATKGNESKYQTLLKETKKTAAQIRSRIFEFLGGGELTFEEAYKLAKLAKQATGVREAFILAVLDRESALGRNVGRCSYQTAMHPTRDIPTFLALVSKLNLSPNSVMVSCPNSDGAYGGAMGPAQFIPSTWKLYENKISEVTGANPANPWNNAHAFVATALYLKDALESSSCASYLNQASRERCAAAKYYAGGNWKNHLWGYGNRVVTKASQFQEDIDILSS